MSKKTHYDYVVAEISNFGTVFRNNVTGVSEFIPSSAIQQETHIKAPITTKIQEPSTR